MSKELFVDTIVDTITILDEDEKSTNRTLAKIVAALLMFIPLTLALFGLPQYAAIINAIAFGVAIIKLNIPKKVFGIESSLTQFLDFMWFTFIYIYFVLQGGIYAQDPEGHRIWWDYVFSAFSPHPVDMLAIILGWSALLLAIGAIISFILLIFWQYNRLLKGTNHTTGGIASVYFGLSVFTMFLGLGGTTLLNYLIILVVLYDIIIKRRRKIEEIASKASKTKDALWLHLLKASTNPKVAAYTLPLFTCGFVTGFSIIFIDFTNPIYFPYIVLLFAILICTVLFIANETSMKISVPIYLVLIVLCVILANIVSPIHIMIELFQSSANITGIFNSMTAENVAGSWLQTTSEFGMTILQLGWGRFVHVILASFSGFLMAYGSSIATQSITKASTKNNQIGWTIFSLAFILEPIMWTTFAFLSGILSPSLIAITQNFAVSNISLSLGAFAFLVYPFFLEVEYAHEKGLPISWVGGNRYLVLAFLLFLVHFALSYSFYSPSLAHPLSILIATFIVVGIVSTVLVWFPYFWKKH
ncbi:MAG: hypothetical protein JW779_02105 [Candidatus Thorarchaeota archaeon]|nr:hypothetical protein [Candidatus Thorarchaeota archaeon]